MALTRAQSLDASADQLASRGLYSKASEQRLEAATAYEAAAQAVGDASTSRTLMMLAQRQRDNAQVLLQKAQCAKAQPAQSQPSPSQRTGQLRPRTRQQDGGLTTLQASRKQLEGASNRRFLREAAPSQSTLSLAAPPAASTSSMTESKISRRSDSPLNSGSPNASIYPEGSFMVLRDDASDADPFRRFNTAVDALLGQMSQPVAFASLPLAAQPPPPKPPAPTTEVSRITGYPPEESFYVVEANVPSTPTSAAFLPHKHFSSPKRPASSSSKASLADSKTVEELAEENATLKEALNNLSLQHEQLASAQKRERENLKQSIMSLRTDIKRESDRVLRVPAQSFISSNPVSPPAIAEELEQQPARTATAAHQEALQQEVASLKNELQSAQASAQKYKNRYDQLREAIKEKRMKKDQQQQQSAQSSPDKPA